MSGKVTINQTTGNIVCINEVVQGQLTVGSLIGKNGGPVNVNSDMVVNGKTQFNGNVQALAGISSGSVPIWLGQDDIDVAGGILVLSTSGLYQLKESVQGSFLVTANDVTLNMSNQTITPGLNSPLYGIQVAGNNFKGWNGTIKGFVCGVWVDSTNGTDLQNLNVLNTVVPLVSLAQPAVSAGQIPAKFAAGPTKNQPQAAPTMKKEVTKPNYTPSDAAKAKKDAFIRRVFGKVSSPNKKSAPKKENANSQKVAHVKQAKWRETLKTKNVNELLKPSTLNDDLDAHAAAKQKTWVGPHNSVPFAGIYVENCYNVSMNGIVCDGSGEVGVVLYSVYGFSLQNMLLTNGNRGMTVAYSRAGYVNNVTLTGNTDSSDYGYSATLDINNSTDIQCCNVQATNNHKGVYSETFESNSGIVSVVGCKNTYFADCSFSDNGSNYFDSSYPTLSVLSAFGNTNCTFENCHMDGNFRDNTDMPGGYLYACACMYNETLTFDGCTASTGNIYNAGDSELAGWLMVANFNVTLKNCEASTLYAYGTTYGSYVSSFIFVYTMGLSVVNCKATGLSNYSDDNSGYIVHLAIYEGCNGAVVTSFQCDGNGAGCDQDNFGVDIDSSYGVVIKNSSVNQLYSNNSRALGIRMNNTYDCVVDGCVATGQYGNYVGAGVYANDCFTCTVTNSVGSGNWGSGFIIEGNSQQCTVQNNKGNDNLWAGFCDDSYSSNAWFGNTAAGNDQNISIYGNGNTYIFYSNDVQFGNPWVAPGWLGAPPVPGPWDNVDIRYD